MTSKKPTAIVYIDGLNLYRQNLSFHPEVKWLNPLTMAQLLLPTHEICLIRYFSAEVKAAVADSAGLERQKLYLRALKTLGTSISIHLGNMITTQRKYMVVPRELDENGAPRLQKVKKTEEKGTDTAIASYMVLDSARGAADLFVLLSSDSDFEPVMNLLKNELHVATALFSPIENPSASLLKCQPLLTKIVRRSILQASQFPDLLQDLNGTFERPGSWKKTEPPYLARGLVPAG